jgi:hypothetical protein
MADNNSSDDETIYNEDLQEGGIPTVTNPMKNPLPREVPPTKKAVGSLPANLRRPEDRNRLKKIIKQVKDKNQNDWDAARDLEVESAPLYNADEDASIREKKQKLERGKEKGVSQETIEEAEDTTDIFDELPVVFIGIYSFDNKELVDNFGDRNTSSDKIVSLLKRVFQKKYPITRVNGMPKIPSKKSDKELLIKLFDNYFKRLRTTIIKEKKQHGNSMTLRQKIDQLQNIKLLKEHFEEAKEKFPYHLFEQYISNEDYLDFKGDLVNQINKIKFKERENDRIRSLLRQFAKLYLLQRNNDEYTLSDPGESEERFELFLENVKEKIPDALYDILPELRKKIQQEDKKEPDLFTLKRLLMELVKQYNEMEKTDSEKKDVVNPVASTAEQFATSSGGEYSINEGKESIDSMKEFVLHLFEEYKRLKEEKDEIIKDKESEVGAVKDKLERAEKECKERRIKILGQLRAIKAGKERRTKAKRAARDVTAVSPPPEATQGATAVSPPPEATQETVQQTAPPETTQEVLATPIQPRDTEKAIETRTKRRAPSPPEENSLGLGSLFGNSNNFSESPQTVDTQEVVATPPPEATQEVVATPPPEATQEVVATPTIFDEDPFINPGAVQQSKIQQSKMALYKNAMKTLGIKLPPKKQLTKPMIFLSYKTIKSENKNNLEKLNEIEEAYNILKNIDSYGMKLIEIEKSKMTLYKDAMKTLEINVAPNKYLTKKIVDEFYNLVKDKYKDDSEKLKKIEDAYIMLNNITFSERTLLSKQQGGSKDPLYKYCIQIADDRLDDFLIDEPLPFFGIIESFDKSIIRETNEKYLLEIFVKHQLEEHFTSDEMKDFFTQFQLAFDKMEDLSQLCFVLYEICNTIKKEDDVDTVRYKSTDYNSSFDKLEQILKNSSFDFYDIASKQLHELDVINIKYHNNHIYFKTDTDSFERTYEIDSKLKLEKAEYDFNEELYSVNNKLVYFFFILSVYNTIKSDIKDLEIVDTLLKHTRTTKRNLKRSVKKLMKDKIDG